MSINEYSLWRFPEDISEEQIWLSWLVRLRWVAILAQTVTVAFTFRLLSQPERTLPALGALICILVIANFWAIRTLNAQRPIRETALLGQLGLDVSVLTGFFVLCGGHHNPFTPLYMVHIAMGAVMLKPQRATILSVIVSLCYLLTHSVYLPLHLSRHALGPDTLQRIGDVTAFTITTAAVTIFVAGLAWSLQNRKQQLLAQRERTARTDRLRSVGTMAAGAAHELNTPLSTIGLRTRRLQRRHQDADSSRDAEVILEQLQRCTRIVEQLLISAGDPSASGLERAKLGDLVRQGVTLWSKSTEMQVVVDDANQETEVELPRVAFIQALINLLENARQAQEVIACTTPIVVKLSAREAFGVIEILDRGCGLPDATDQVGTPFFTTKVNGTGLGVFVAQTVADGAGGGLQYTRRDDGGTHATWWFPRLERRSS